MKINLLQKMHDKVCDNFINGKINYHLFFKLENKFLKDSYLFTIYPN